MKTKIENMQKKGEIVTLVALILILVATGVITMLSLFSQSPVYVGDSSTGFYYNINSDNEKCIQGEIKIEESNVVIYKTKEQYENNGFVINETCY